MQVKPLLSIIIPVYKTQDYLISCLDSIFVNLDCPEDIQVLVIDDGSPDRAGELADEYAVEHENVSVIHKTNGGLSSARNEGMRVALGDYMLFLDSDDVLAPHSIVYLLDLLRDGKYDLIYFEYDRIGENGLSIGPDPLEKKYPDEGPISPESLLSLVLDGCIADYAWQYVAKRVLFEDGDIFFPERRNFEDIATTYKVILQASNCLVDGHCLVRYRQRPGSILHDNYKGLSASFLDAEEALCDRVGVIEAVSPQHVGRARRSRACFFLWAAWDNHCLPKSRSDEAFASFMRLTDALMIEYVEKDRRALRLRDMTKYVLIRLRIMDALASFEAHHRRTK